MKLIRELCKEEKDRNNFTFQDIADRAEIPLSTVKNYFSIASKAPSVYTVGPICAALGVSLDKYFGIKPEDTPAELSEQQDRIADLEQKNRDFEKDLAYKAEIGRMQRATIRKLQFVVIVLALVALMYFIRFDVLNPNYGLVKW